MGGNQALDGGIVGLGLGALGAAVLGPTIQGALNGGQQSQGYSCGRRKRQANFGGSQASGGQEIDGEERFFLPTGQGCTCNTNGRRRRQAPGEDQPGTRFFGGLFGGQQPHCGSCCYNSQPFNNNNGFNSNFQNQGFNNQNQGFNNQGFNSQNQGFNNQINGRFQCYYSLTFRDQNGNTHGACQRRDNTGRTWCYTTGWSNNCGDLQTSKRYPNNPWSYTACSNQGR